MKRRAFLNNLLYAGGAMTVASFLGAYNPDECEQPDPISADPPPDNLGVPQPCYGVSAPPQKDHDGIELPKK